ncbi:MAG: hypothetical protein ABJZ55_26080 [Fuerstiella sp.]
MMNRKFFCSAKKRSMLVVLRVLFVAICVMSTGRLLAAGQQVIVVVGVAGTPEYADEFRSWAEQWRVAATDGQASIQILGLSQQDTEADAGVLRDQLLQAVQAASSKKTDEPLWLVLIGHGTFDGRTARFNLPGPDISSLQLADAFDTSQRPLAIINCSSCSAPFINALSGVDRVIITATKSGQESQYSRFGRYMARAVSRLDADLDRDGQTSLREAWLVAASDTAAFYESEGRLATEHALLDDNGDEAGSATTTYQDGRLRKNLKEPEKVDGQTARKWHLVRSPEEQLLTSDQRQQRDDLEAKLEELRKRKTTLTETQYFNQLEGIMLPLAKLYQSASKTLSNENSN